MKKQYFSVLIILLLSWSIYGQTEIKVTWKSITQSGYTIQYPSNWEPDVSGEMGSSLILYSKQVSIKDLFAENVNVLIQDLAGLNMDLDKFIEISEEQIRTLLKDSKIIENKRIADGKIPYQKLIYIGKQASFTFMFEQYCYIKDEKAYIITFSSEETQYKKYKKVGQKILNSFTLE